MNEEDMNYMTHSFYVDRMAESEAAAIMTDTREETSVIYDLILAYFALEFFSKSTMFDYKSRVVLEVGKINNKATERITAMLSAFAKYEAKTFAKIYKTPNKLDQSEIDRIVGDIKIKFNGKESYLGDSIRQAIEYYNNSLSVLLSDIESLKPAGIMSATDVKRGIDRSNSLMRTHLSGVLETFVTAIQAQVAERMAFANQQKFQNRYQWISVLDSRTSDLCRRLHGKVFEFGAAGAIKPPAHYRCRSRIRVLQK